MLRCSADPPIDAVRLPGRSSLSVHPCRGSVLDASERTIEGVVWQHRGEREPTRRVVVAATARLTGRPNHPRRFRSPRVSPPHSSFTLARATPLRHPAPSALFSVPKLTSQGSYHQPLPLLSRRVLLLLLLLLRLVLVLLPRCLQLPSRSVLFRHHGQRCARVSRQFLFFLIPDDVLIPSARLAAASSLPGGEQCSPSSDRASVPFEGLWMDPLIGAFSFCLRC